MLLHTLRPIDTQSIPPMKTFSLLSIVFLWSIIPCQAGDIAPADAKGHVGEVVTAHGTVDGVKVTGKPIFLDFGGR